MEETTKLTAEVNRDTYNAIARDMHHGQMTQLVRAFAIAIELLIKQNKKDDIYLWLYSAKPLTLPPPIRKDE